MPAPTYTNSTSNLRKELFKTFSTAFGANSRTTHRNSPRDPDEEEHRRLLIYNLRNVNSLSQRSQAAEEITRKIHEFAADSIPDIWSSSSDLIKPSVSQKTRRIALHLLISCIEYITMSQEVSDNDSIRLAFYLVIMENCSLIKDGRSGVDPDLDLFIECLQKLTSNGNRLNQLREPFEDTPSLVQFLDTVFEAILNECVEHEPRALINLLCFTTDCIRHDTNFKLNPNCVNSIIQIASHTSNESVLVDCLCAIDVLTNKGLVHTNQIGKIVEVMAGSFSISNRLHKQVIVLLLSFLKNDIWPDFCNTLLKLVHGLERPGATASFLRLLTVLLSSEDFENDYGRLKSTIDCKSLCGLFNVVFSSDSILLRSEILRSINMLLDSHLFLDWAKNDHSFWQSTDEKKLSIFPIFKLLLSDEELREPNKKVITSIYHSLLKIVQKDRYTWIGYTNIQDVLSVMLKDQEFFDDELIRYMVKVLEEKVDIFSDSTEIIQMADIMFKSTSCAEVRVSFLRLVEKILRNLVGRKNLDEDKQIKIISSILCEFQHEIDQVIICAVGELLYNISEYLPLNTLQNLEHSYIDPGFSCNTSGRRKSIVYLSSFSARNSVFDHFKLETITKSFTKSFVWNSSNGSADKCAHYYKKLITIFEFAMRIDSTDLLLIISRALARIRCSSRGEFYLTQPKNVDGISAALGRNKNLESGIRKHVWSFPEELDYIPPELLERINKNVRFKQQQDVTVSSVSIDISLWLSLALQIIDHPSDWEIYSYMLTFLCPQVSNVALFKGYYHLIEAFREMICKHLIEGVPSSLSLPKDLYKGNLHVVYVRNLSPILAYHCYLPKQSSDELVNALLHGLRSWEKPLIPVFHILTVCCYEVPSSIKKFLTPILTQLQTRITSSFVIPTILEFILALSDSPDIISHLTVEEFKRVFAIAFKLIQTSRDLEKRAESESIIHPMRYDKLDAEKLPSTQTFKITTSIAHFFLSLSYKVISSWLLRMKMVHRRQLAPFITKNLILSCESNKNLNHDTLAYLELVSNFTFSEIDLRIETVPTDNPHRGDPSYTCSRWVYGDGIVTVETHKPSGKSLITVRKSIGASCFNLSPVNPPFPHTYDLFPDEEQDSKEQTPDDTTIFTSNNVLLQLCYRPSTNIDKPIPIPSTETSIMRSIDMFDKIPVVEFHKIGMLYIAPDQTTEGEVLSNTSGSHQYHWFLKQLGHFIKLREASNFYIGGLDPESDGEYALVWNDKTTQAIFHTVTLMPNSVDDKYHSLKKRHIGNNFVNVFYDESGNPDFEFNLVKSQFNFINIAVEPCETFGKNEKGISTHYKVTAYRKTGVPGIFSTCHFKVLTQKNVAKYVRHLSLIANTFASSWHNMSSQDFCSTWAARCKQLSMIKQRVVNYHNKLREKAEEKPDTGSNFSAQLTENVESSDHNLFYDYVDEKNDSEMYVKYEFTSFT